MHRTTILLPTDLKAKANQLAEKMGISLDELIRDSLANRCASKLLKNNLFFDDHSFYEGKTPIDASSRVDDYLYQEE